MNSSFCNVQRFSRRHAVVGAKKSLVVARVLAEVPAGLEASPEETRGLFYSAGPSAAKVQRACFMNTDCGNMSSKYRRR